MVWSAPSSVEIENHDQLTIILITMIWYSNLKKKTKFLPVLLVCFFLFLSFFGFFFFFLGLFPPFFFFLFFFSLLVVWHGTWSVDGVAFSSTTLSPGGRCLPFASSSSSASCSAIGWWWRYGPAHQPLLASTPLTLTGGGLFILPISTPPTIGSSPFFFFLWSFLLYLLI